MAKLTIEGDIYNGTKDTGTFVTSHDWSVSGNTIYPNSIQIGTWGKFTQFGTVDQLSAAVVYRVKIAGDQFDILLAWRKNSSGSIKVYTEIQPVGHAWDWNDISTKLDSGSSKCSCEYKGCLSAVELGGNLTATLGQKN